MNDIGIGAVGAAIIAGLISLLGLIIGKEQKVSEFRQAWIDELRKCLVSYLANINAIADTIRVAVSKGLSPTGLTENYKALNEANHGIRLRVNDTEEPSIALLKAMDEFEALASSNSQLTPNNIRAAEEKFLSASKELLKFEWDRVKEGEKTYSTTKRFVKYSIGAMAVIFVALVCLKYLKEGTDETEANSHGDVTTLVYCPPAAALTSSPNHNMLDKDQSLAVDEKLPPAGKSTTTPTCPTPSEHGTGAPPID